MVKLKTWKLFNINVFKNMTASVNGEADREVESEICMIVSEISLYKL